VSTCRGTACRLLRLPDTRLAWNRPLTRPATAGESAVACHPLPRGEGQSRFPLIPNPYSLFLRLDEAFLDREENQFCRAVEVERVHHSSAVYGDCVDADVKKRSNFLVGFSLGD